MQSGEAFDDTQSPDADWKNGETNKDSCPAPWARLVALERTNPDIDLWESDTVIGRAQLNGNRKVSKFHCRIYKEEDSREILMSNLSKNGTLMNGSWLDNDKRCTLQHGDEINLGPRGSGVPHYTFHLLDRSSGYEKKRSHEDLEADLHSDNAKRLKIMKVCDDLKCCICLGVWHDVVTVAPCLHNFCNGCFSEWYKNKGMSRCNCPQCRERVVFVKKNHTLSSIIEDYLQEFPSLRRPSEETAHLDQRAIVGNNFVNVGGSDSCTSDEDDDDVDTASCPQCPGSNALTQTGDAFCCGPNTSHLQCTACSMLLPERVDTQVPQKCAGCSRVFCGLYWRSQGTIRSTPMMSACIMRKVNERTDANLPVGAFWGNTYEQDVTRRYLQEQRLQMQDVLIEWLGKMDRDETDKPMLPSRPQSPFSESYFCSQCEEAIVNHLLYKFRLSVPKAELPPDAAGLEDCWYGRLCRTQSHRDSHARRYNHVCEPTSRARSSS